MHHRSHDSSLRRRESRSRSPQRSAYDQRRDALGYELRTDHQGGSTLYKVEKVDNPPLQDFMESYARLQDTFPSSTHEYGNSIERNARPQGPFPSSNREHSNFTERDTRPQDTFSKTSSKNQRPNPPGKRHRDELKAGSRKPQDALEEHWLRKHLSK
ncbi:hypothetical protein CC80DRAFT_542971 [Byssothecium circinans]|uniref:Uncharacterized protein n=1 Tax=Byssothecium circinans TaxID=147558 RepID=A0A6A5UA55_9PLEO|nr:hypothetical protein CC80DRAFT_542971 [Byssothecium circinans]